MQNVFFEKYFMACIGHKFNTHIFVGGSLSDHVEIFKYNSKKSKVLLLAGWSENKE